MDQFRDGSAGLIESCLFEVYEEVVSERPRRFDAEEVTLPATLASLSENEFSRR